MKIYKRALLLSMFFVLILTMFFKSDLRAEQENPKVYTHKWEEDKLLNSNENIKKTFYVPQNMSCSNFTVSLKVKPSPTLIKNLSSISLVINNTKVHSVMLDKLNEDGLIRVEIPKDLIYKGENSISIEGFLKSTKEKCEINDDLNWAIVEKDSSFSFDYERIESIDIRNIFDNTYYSDGVSSNFNISIADSLTPNNYSQLASISALIGFTHKNKSTDVDPRIFKYSQLASLDRETIMIGSVDQIKAFSEDLLTDEEWKKAEENGYVAIRKIGNNNHFIVMVSDQSQVETFCEIFKNKSSLSQIRGKDYVLDKKKIVDEKTFDTNPSLRSLDYTNSLQSGNGVKQFDYYFTVPAKKTLTSDNKITFVYKNSSLVDYDEGYVNVEINGENIMSKNLTRDKVEDKLEFTIPEKYFAYGGFNISLKFNLKPGIENCTSQSHDNIWVEIDSLSSNLKLDLKDRKRYSLLNSQGLLQNSNGNLEGEILVDSYKNISTYSIAKLSSYLGKVSQGVRQLSINQAKGKDGSANFILSLTKSPLMEGVNKNLRIPVDKEGQFTNKDLFVQNTPSLASIQVTSDGEKLVLAASDPTELNKAIQNYSEVSSPKDTVIMKDGKVLESFGEEELAIDKALGKIRTSNEILIALFILILSFAFIFMIYFRKIK